MDDFFPFLIHMDAYNSCLSFTSVYSFLSLFSFLLYSRTLVQEIAIKKCIEQIHMFSCELLMQRVRSGDEDDGVEGSYVYGHFYKT
jgi:hypothetical protein